MAYVMGEVNQLACPENKPWPRSGNKVLCIPGLKPFFRLHPPPSGGLRSIKRGGLMKVETWAIGALPLMS